MLSQSSALLAPHARWRSRAVTYEEPGASLGEPACASTTPGRPELHDAAPVKPRYWAWADLMRRAFEIDVLACPRCGGRMRLVATIEDPRVIRQILARLGLPAEVPPPRPPPARPAGLFAGVPA